MEAARREIHRHGFRAASLNRILASTGLTKGAVYHHFSSKHGLGYAVLDEFLAKAVEEIWIRPLNIAENPIDCLQEIRTGFYAQPDLDLILLGCPLNNLSVEMSYEDEGFRERLNRIYGDWRNALSQAFSRGVKKGPASVRTSTPRLRPPLPWPLWPGPGPRSRPARTGPCWTSAWTAWPGTGSPCGPEPISALIPPAKGDQAVF